MEIFSPQEVDITWRLFELFQAKLKDSSLKIQNFFQIVMESFYACTWFENLGVSVGEEGPFVPVICCQNSEERDLQEKPLITDWIRFPENKEKIESKASQRKCSLRIP